MSHYQTLRQTEHLHTKTTSTADKYWHEARKWIKRPVVEWCIVCFFGWYQESLEGFLSLGKAGLFWPFLLLWLSMAFGSDRGGLFSSSSLQQQCQTCFGHSTQHKNFVLFKETETSNLHPDKHKHKHTHHTKKQRKTHTKFSHLQVIHNFLTL